MYLEKKHTAKQLDHIFASLVIQRVTALQTVHKATRLGYDATHGTFASVTAASEPRC